MCIKPAYWGAFRRSPIRAAKIAEGRLRCRAAAPERFRGGQKRSDHPRQGPILGYAGR
jgi:hypothetical protein